MATHWQIMRYIHLMDKHLYTSLFICFCSLSLFAQNCSKDLRNEIWKYYILCQSWFYYKWSVVEDITIFLSWNNTYKYKKFREIISKDILSICYTLVKSLQKRRNENSKFITYLRLEIWDERKNVTSWRNKSFILRITQ